jgi:methyl-accepting chemotaxis protein
MQRFRNIDITLWLVLLGVALLIPLGAVVAMFVDTAKMLTQTAQGVVHDGMATVMSADSMRYQLVLVGREARMMHEAADAEAREAHAKRIAEARANLAKDLALLKAAPLNAAARLALTQFEGALPDYSSVVDDVVTSLRAGKSDEGMRNINRALPMLVVMDAATVKLHDEAVRGVQERQAAAEVAQTSAWWRILSLLALALGILIFAMVTLTRSISRPLAEMEQKLVLMGDGDLTQRIDYDSHDEIGRLARTLNATISAIASALSQVREQSSQVATSAGGLRTTANEISTGASEQASGFEETAASLEEITSTVKSTADNTAQALAFAAQSREAAERGQEVVNTAVSAMEALSESSQQIADIVSTIDGIAFQTNLLALNAAVEAARAGEQGRGFAVVANEVRTLAQRSASAAREIKTLIQTSISRVDAGVTAVGQSGEALRGIVQAAGKVATLMADISGATREQTLGVDQVNKAVVQMDTVTQRNASQTAELTHTADALSEAAQTLTQAVSMFRLEVAQAPVHAPRASAPRPSAPRASAPLSEAGFTALPSAPHPPRPPPSSGSSQSDFQEF